MVAYTETSDEIPKDHPGPTAIIGAPQVVKLPFAVELHFHQEIIWNAGDNRLRNKFWAQNLPAQRMLVFCVTFHSTAKACTGTIKVRARTVPIGRNWATPPHRGGYSGDYDGGYMGRADGGDGGGGRDGRGGGGIGGGEASFGVGGPAGVVPPAAGVDAEASEAAEEIRRLVRQAQGSFGESGGHSHAVADTPPSATTCTPEEKKDVPVVQVTSGAGVEID